MMAPRRHFGGIRTWRVGVTASLLVCTAFACGRASQPGTVVAGQPSPSSQSDRPGPPAGTAADPCSVLTPGEVASAVGANAGAPQRGPAQCRYPTGAGVVIVVVQGTAAQGRFEMTKAELSGRDAPGIGDRAFLARKVIGVLQNNVFLEIKTPEAAGPNERALVALARAAVARL